MTAMISANQFQIRTSPLFGPRNKIHPCQICRSIKIDINHRHHSTSYARLRLAEVDEPDMDCVTCKVRHGREIQGERYKVFVGSSTLHDVWLEDAVRNPFHIDNITICGGTMKMGRLNYAHAYNTQNKGVDVVAQFGLNDVRKIEASQFKQEMLMWIWSINVHERKYGVEDTIGFVKMPHAPCMAWLPGNGPFPTTNYRNFLYKVDTFNKIIGEVNTTSGMCQNIVSFQNEGQRTARNGLAQHEMRNWREEKEEDMMHLKDYLRAKMYKRVVKYFKENTIQCEEDSYI